ncbi:MAG TPA: hypothetical protein VIZ65_04685 [Cellvibrionaceae bacterium]
MKTMLHLKKWLFSFLIASSFFTATSQALTTDLGSQPSPAHFNYTNTFAAPNSQYFTDWWAFEVDSSLFDATTLGIKLSTAFGIANLETKLYATVSTFHRNISYYFSFYLKVFNNCVFPSASPIELFWILFISAIYKFL